jgi:hypothetical protein
VIFFGAGGLGMGHAAATNTRELTIDGFIRLSPEHACIFYFVVTAACFAFVFSLLFYILPQNFIPRSIVLGQDAITLPGAGFDASHYTIHRSQINWFKVTVVRNRRFLRIYTPQRSFSVNPTWLSDASALEQIVNWLSSAA